MRMRDFWFIADSVPHDAMMELFDCAAELAVAETEFELALENAREPLEVVFKALEKVWAAEARSMLIQSIHGVGK